MPRRPSLRTASVAAAFCVAATGASAWAGGGVGVALDVGRVDVREPLKPGVAYQLPTVRVRNPGTVAASYRIAASPSPGSHARVPGEKWLSFAPEELRLAPGRSAPVRVRLKLPAHADAGRYEGLIAAQIVSRGKGPQVGAAVAARLTFTVKSTGWLDSLWRRLAEFFSDHAPLSWIVPVACALGLGVSQLRRRYDVSVTRRGA